MSIKIVVLRHIGKCQYIATKYKRKPDGRMFQGKKLFDAKKRFLNASGVHEYVNKRFFYLIIFLHPVEL